MSDQKSALYKIFDLKAEDFYWIFGVEGEDRLAPFKTETLKSLKKISFQAGSDNSFHPKHYSTAYANQQHVVKKYLKFGIMIALTLDKMFRTELKYEL